MSSMNKYKIRKQAQIPLRVNLIDPATNKETDDWLEIRSSLSDEFTRAREETMQAVQTIQEPNKEKRAQIVADLQLGLKAALVAGWSFEEEFTRENVMEFLRESPQLQHMVTAVADDAASFFGKPSETSSDGRKKK